MNNFKRGIIAVDNSAFAAPLAQTGFELLKRLNAEIAVLSVIDTRTLLGTDELSAGETITLERDAALQNLNVLIKNVFQDYPVMRYIKEGDPSAEILAFSKEWSADMLVMGTHGRKGLSRLLLGSVAEKVLRHSDIPLTIIPVSHD